MFRKKQEPLPSRDKGNMDTLMYVGGQCNKSRQDNYLACFYCIEFCVSQSFSIRATAYALMPSSLPVNPNFSVVVAFMEMSSMSMPIT